MIKYQKDTTNIVTLTMDMSNRTVNIINHEIGKAFIPVLKQLQIERDKGALAGVIITSDKKSFLAGGDLDYLFNAQSAKSIFNYTQTLKSFFRALEILNVPVVAAINGTALGSGFELALACHYRIALNLPNTRLGFPEVNLGIMPGGGAVVRLMWSLGIEQAFSVIEKGKRHNVKEALEVGLIDDIASSKEDMFLKAHQWIFDHPGYKENWDKGGEIFGGDTSDPKINTLLAKLAANLYKKTKGNYPAPQAILNTIAEAASLDFDTALRVESRFFTNLVLNPVAKNMTRAFWYDMNGLRQGKSRPKGFGRFRARKIGIIGAGIMGSGIAFTCASRGIEVILKDISRSVAERGKQQSEKWLDELLAIGDITVSQKEDVLSKIQPTENAADFQHCDLIIEAVFENKELKAKVTRETEMEVARDSFIASNTSSISITELAKAASSRPESYIGLHFFSPVHEMQLVEIICGEETSDETLARAFDFVQHIRKIPIVVKDNPGFFVSRLTKSYLMEGILMLSEGQLPASIENAGTLCGMDRGPLAYSDDVSLSLLKERAEQGGNTETHPAYPILKHLVDELKRYGKTKKAGLYTYENNERQGFWKDLSQHFPVSDNQIAQKELQSRLLMIQALEALKMLEEQVVSNEVDVNIGSIYGTGFPAYTGGCLHYIRHIGLKQFKEQCLELASKYGDRFLPIDSLDRIFEEV